MKYEVYSARIKNGSLLLTLRIALSEIPITAEEARTAALRPKGYRWAEIPDAAGVEYLEGVGLLALATKYETDTKNVRSKLTSLGIKIRRPGVKFGTPKPEIGKLTDEEVKWAIDNTGAVTDAEAGRHLGVSREYVRQLRLRAGKEGGRAKQASFLADVAKAKQQAIAACEAEKLRFIDTISEMYSSGASLIDIAIACGIKPTSQCGYGKIGQLRKQYPGKFPHRMPNHWKVKNGAKP